MLGITIRKRKDERGKRARQNLRHYRNIKDGKKIEGEEHLARSADNRWSKMLTDRTPGDSKRSRERPDSGWRDEIEKFGGRQNLAEIGTVP